MPDPMTPADPALASEAAAPVNPRVTLPIPLEGDGSLAWWKAQAQAAKDKRQPFEDEWRQNVSRYQRKYLKADPTSDTVIVPLDYSYVEQKKAQLFVHMPEIQLTPKKPGAEQITPLFQAVLKHELGPYGVDAEVAMRECLFDMLCPSGIGACKIGYEQLIKQVAAPVNDPMGMPVVDPMTGAPMTQMVPVPVWERYFMERFSPIHLLIPASFVGSKYDRAPWLGRTFEMDPSSAVRAFGPIAEQAKASAPADTQESLNLRESESSKKDRTSKVVCGCEIYYYASLLDPEAHPELVYEIVWLEGIEEPVVHRPTPNQVLGENGRVVGMKGFPLHVGALRSVSDGAYPMSDCAMSRPQVDEISRGRTQMIQQRNRSLPLRWFNATALSPEQVDRIQRGDIQGLIPVDGDGSQLLGQVATAQFPRENFSFDEIGKRDIDRAWGFGDNQQGIQTESARTATETANIQANTNVRMQSDRARFLEFVVGAAEKLAALLQRYADEPDFVEVIGPDGTRTLTAWDRTKIAGEFLFAAKPDSTIRQDAAADRKEALDRYQLMANDPNVNRQELLKDLILKSNQDPAKLLTAPPPPTPDLPKVSLSFSGEDFNPLTPGYAGVYAVLKASGIELPPPLTAPGPMSIPPGSASDHPGAVAGVEPLSKHQQDETGQLPGGGSMAAQGRPM